MAVFLLVLLMTAAAQPVELEDAVKWYWDYLQARDKNSALEFVAPESRQDFSIRREPFFRSWKLVDIELKSETRASVTVAVDRMVEGAGRFFKTGLAEDWVFDGQTWKVQVKKVSPEDLTRIYNPPSADSEENPPEGLRVLPELVKIEFLSRTQRAAVIIFNGLDQPVEITALELDPERFEIIERSEKINPGGRGKIAIRYTGSENEKELRSRIKFVLKEGDGADEKAIEIPILYNHVSAATRGLFALSDEEVKKLKRGDKLTPVIQ